MKINFFLDRFGPLMQLSAFAFEGMLKFCGTLIHGTRGYGSQIGHHLAAESYLNFEGELQFPKMINLQLKSFCNQLRNFNVKNNGLLGISSICPIRNLAIENCENFFFKTNLNFDSNVTVASRAVYNNKGTFNSL